jgi:alpha-beta hydrolase superfamily lysophospholipase
MITETDVGSAPRAREAGTPYRAITEDGVDLALTRFPARRAGQAPVLLTHGTFSNGGICARLAAYLAEHGFDAWVLDLRGHGGSQRAVPKPDFEAFGLLDVPAAIEAVRTHTGRRDLYLVGHSGGGLAFLMHLARRPAVQRDVVGLVTLASQATDACATLRGRLIVTGSRLATNLLGYTPGPAWRLGPENEAKGVLETWFRWNRTARWTGHDGFDYLAALGAVTIPTWCLAGAGDRVIAPVQGCRRLFDALGSPQKQWTVCGRAEGFSEDFGHARLVASRAAQREIWPRIKDWLGRTELLDG